MQQRGEMKAPPEINRNFYIFCPLHHCGCLFFALCRLSLTLCANQSVLVFGEFCLVSQIFRFCSWLADFALCRLFITLRQCDETVGGAFGEFQMGNLSQRRKVLQEKHLHLDERKTKAMQKGAFDFFTNLIVYA